VKKICILLEPNLALLGPMNPKSHPQMRKTIPLLRQFGCGQRGNEQQGPLPWIDAVHSVLFARQERARPGGSIGTKGELLLVEAAGDCRVAVWD
jgi:hypothetical protein